MPRPQDIPDANAKKAEKKVLEPPVANEREWRRYVKRTGGLKKDLDLKAPSIENPTETIGQRLDFLKKQGKVIDKGWDESIVVPGFENIMAQMPSAKPQALLEQQVVSQAQTIKDLQKSVVELTNAVKSKK